MSDKTLYKDELKGMLSPVTFYESPVLTPVHEIKPGHLIEALPGTRATMLRLDTKELTTTSPTGFIGYVRGECKSYFAEYSDDFKAYFAGLSVGDFAIEKIVPLIGPRGGVPSSHIYSLRNWAPEGTNAYLVLGEVNALSASKLHHIEDELTECLYGRGVVLLPEQLEVVRMELYRFVRERKGKNIVFNAPDGAQYPLEEIVLSLGQK